MKLILKKILYENSQKTFVLTEQTHESETSGHATVQQQQSVKAIGNNEETEAEEVNIKAAVSNGLDIIKEVSHYVVKIVQSIVVNDEKVDSLEGEYIVKNNSSILKELKYEQKYEWGILSIFNSIGLSTTEDNDLQSVLSSIIKLDFFIQHDKNQDQETQAKKSLRIREKKTQEKKSQKNQEKKHQGKKSLVNQLVEPQERKNARIQVKKNQERKKQKNREKKHQEKKSLSIQEK